MSKVLPQKLMQFIDIADCSGKKFLLLLKTELLRERMDTRDEIEVQFHVDWRDANLDVYWYEDDMRTELIWSEFDFQMNQINEINITLLMIIRCMIAKW